MSCVGSKDSEPSRRNSREALTSVTHRPFHGRGMIAWSHCGVRTPRGVAERSGPESSGRHGVDILPSDTQPNSSNEMDSLVFDMQCCEVGDPWTRAINGEGTAT